MEKEFVLFINQTHNDLANQKKLRTMISQYLKQIDYNV